MGQAALAFDDFQARGVEQAFGSLADAFSRHAEERSSEGLADLERNVIAAESEATQSLNELRAQSSIKLNLIERVLLDGFPINVDLIIDHFATKERRDAEEFKKVLKWFDVIAKVTRAGSPGFSRVVKNASSRMEAVKEAHLAELRSIRMRLRKIQERAAALSGGETRFKKATDAYGVALIQTFGYAKVAGLDLQAEGDYPVYVMRVQVAPALYRDTGRLLSLEREADEIVERIAPDIVGLLAVQYEPMTSAAE